MSRSKIQKFSKEGSNHMKIIEGNIEDLKEVYKRFEEDFPIDERKEYEQLKMLMVEKKYKLVLAKSEGSDDTIGYSFIYRIEDYETLWMDYIAINEDFRGLGYGSLFFNKILESEGENIKGMFIEIEIPDEKDEKNYKEQLRRVQFYERLGAKKISINYEMPTNNGGLPLYLYFKSSLKENTLSKKQIEESIVSVFDYIHSDIKNKDHILQKVICSI